MTVERRWYLLRERNVVLVVTASLHVSIMCMPTQQRYNTHSHISPNAHNHNNNTIPPSHNRHYYNHHHVTATTTAAAITTVTPTAKGARSF